MNFKIRVGHLIQHVAMVTCPNLAVVKSKVKVTWPRIRTYKMCYNSVLVVISASYSGAKISSHSQPGLLANKMVSMTTAVV